MSVKLSHSLKLWLSQYNWQSFGEKGKLFKKPDRNSLSPLESWEYNIHFSFSSRKWGTLFQISLSLLKTGEKNFRFLFLFSKLEISKKKSLSPLETWEKKIPFSFSSQKWRTFFQISLSPLETGEWNFRFLFLFSKLEKRISNFSFSSRLDFLASRQWLLWLDILIMYQVIKVHLCTMVRMSSF